MKDLVTTIETFIDGWNDRREPFVWTKTADDILKQSTAPSNNFQHATLGPRSLPGIGRHPGRPLAVSLLVPTGVGGHGRRQRGKDPVRADALQQPDPP